MSSKQKIILIKKDILDLKSFNYADLNLNEDIQNMLDKLIEMYNSIKILSVKKDKTAIAFKLTSFLKAKDAITGYDKEICSGEQAKKEIPGIGEGIAKRIQEFKDTGTLTEFSTALTDDLKLKVKTLTELLKVSGIGEVKALSLIEKFNVTSVEDLIYKYKSSQISVCANQLTHHISVGLMFYHDLKLRMPWAEADEIAKIIKKIILKHDEDIIIEVCGSYRRCKETCGDIDVLISKKSGITDKTLINVVQVLSDANLLKGHLTEHGDTKYMGIIQLAGCPGRRIDIRCVAYESMGAAILYFTGSGKFNKIMRFKANQQGYTLNEYGLFYKIKNEKGDQLVTPTEEDVFKVLKFKYLTPNERDF
jgi:DNA polymerase lambda